jgi:hypothetical protein
MTKMDFVDGMTPEQKRESVELRTAILALCKGRKPGTVADALSEVLGCLIARNAADVNATALAVASNLLITARILGGIDPTGPQEDQPTTH